ncbi:hypothetical protein IV37_GL000232 [Fructilactobacillus fructivorans]|nr:hypothetical protein FC73_GL000157 [Fructilactobacillus fructivorans]KRN13509.1 hypothetical protein IV37_GL000232 [Fructilactobacillus fructivorans]KRN40155.1 hypothetical protein IV51_GL000337 [Fructilactobacillus fructivorans]
MGCGNIRYRYEIEKIRGMQTMAVKLNTQYGSIDIDNDVIATVVGGAATDNYGVVGMASKNQFKDNMNEILRKDSYSKGVVVREVNKKVQVDVNVIVSYGTKISEVSRNVQSKVKYNLESMLGINADSVNVIVQGVKVIND